MSKQEEDILKFLKKTIEESMSKLMLQGHIVVRYQTDDDSTFTIKLLQCGTYTGIGAINIRAVMERFATENNFTLTGYADRFTLAWSYVLILTKLLYFFLTVTSPAAQLSQKHFFDCHLACGSILTELNQ